MKLSDELIAQIREATNIVDLVNEHVQLKKRGRNYIGLCPFHNEKTPSFNVLEEKGIFKCFGCGKGGDAFTFLMELESLSFPEAAEKLATRANIEVTSEQTPEQQRAEHRRESLFAATRAAAAWYYRYLRSDQGATAMRYLQDRRLDAETIKTFGLGYAPDASGLATRALANQGFDTQVLESIGLIARGNNDWYERFRGRIIFPVISPTGRIVGFGGRILPGGPKDLAKYINSPDTPIYHKSQILYGLFQAKEAIRRLGYAILVEGYADVLTVHQTGSKNVVAASGTSLTVDQLNLLRRYTTNVVLLFDADQAGRNAAMRGIELAIEAGFDVSTVVLPGGEDPDSFIRTKGAEAFEMALSHRQSFVETKAQWFEEQGALKDPAQMAGAVRSIVETIAKVPDTIKQAFFIKRVAQQFDLSEQMLSSELDRLMKGGKRPSASVRQTAPQAPPRQESSQRTSGGHMTPLADGISIKGTVPVPKSEAAILEAMLADPKGVHDLLNENEFDLDLLTNHVVREIVSYLMQEIESGEAPDVGQLLADYRGNEEVQQVLVECAINPTSFSAHWDANVEVDRSRNVTQARHAAATLMRRDIRRLQQRVYRSIQGVTDHGELDQLMREAGQLAQRLEALKDFSEPAAPDEDE